MIEKISLFFTLNTYLDDALVIHCKKSIYDNEIWIYANKYRYFFNIKNSKKFIVYFNSDPTIDNSIGFSISTLGSVYYVVYS